MAATRSKTNKILGDSLDAFVTNLSNAFKTQLASRNADKELAFNTAVVEQGLSLEDQLSFRQDQLKEVSDDPSERTRLKTEITSLKERITQQDYKDDYLGKLTDYQTGASSIDSLIGWLTEQQANTTDPTILDSIATSLSDANQKKFDLSKQILSDQTNYALNDKSDAVLSSQIAKVTTAKNKALIAGDDASAASYDLQIQALSAAKTQNGIQNDIAQLGVLSSTGGMTSIGLLDSLNTKISGSSTTGAITVGGVTYNSAKDFWTYKRDSYLSDSSGNGFFPSLSTEIKNNLNVLSSKNTLDTSGISTQSNIFNTIAARPELANYQTQIALYKQNAIQTGTDLLANTINNTFLQDYDVNKAVASLGTLKNLGGNVDDTLTKVLVKNSTTKTDQVQGILQSAQQLMQADPTLTPEAAVAQALGAGAGTVISPKDTAGKTEGQIATDAVKTSVAGSGTNDPRTTAVPPTTPGTTPPVGTPPTTPTPAPTTNTHTIVSGETLSGIAQKYGTTTQALAQLNGIADPNKIAAGATIKLPAPAVATTPAPAPAPVAKPTPVATPTPTPTPPTPAPQPTPAQPNPTPTPAPTAARDYSPMKAGETLQSYYKRIGIAGY